MPIADAGEGGTKPEGPHDRLEEQRRAMDAALSYLSYRPRTSREVRRKLDERGFDEEIAVHTLARLIDVGLVDDEAFVEIYVRDRIANRPMGVRRLTEELYLKGIKPEAARPIIQSIFEDEGADERSLALRAAEKKARRLEGGSGDPRSHRRRLASYLGRRGFAYEVIKDVVDDCLTD